MTPLVLFFVAVILAILTYVLGNPWMKTHVLWAWVNADWQPIFGWWIVWELWIPMLVCGLALGALWVPLGWWLRGRLAPLETRWRDRQEQQELAAGRQAQVALSQAQARIQALEWRLATLEGLESREQAVSQAEARARVLLAHAEAQAQQRLAQAQRQAEALRTEAAAALTEAKRQAADWQARSEKIHHQEQTLHDQLAYVCKHATRIHNELHWAAQESRVINWPLVQKETKRLMRGLHRTLPPHKRQDLALVQSAPAAAP